MVRGLVGVALLTTGVACKRGDVPAPRPSATASASAARSGSATAASLAPAPSVSSSAPSKPLDVRVGKVKIMDAARQLVTAWDAALNARDVPALEAVYAPTVWFYGRNMTKQQVLDAKRTALEKAPDFKQTLSNVRLAPVSDVAVNVEFQKTSGGRTVPASLRIEAYGPVYGIVVESDAPTEQMEREMMGCQDTMYSVASGLREVQRTFDEAGPDARTGGLYYPDEGNNRSLSLGFHHDDHFENMYLVEWEDGKFAVTSSHTGEAVPIPAAELKRVQTKCPK